MKKIIALALALIFAIAVVGCSGSTTKPAATTEPEAATDVIATPDTIEVTPMTYAEYAAADLNTPVIVDTYVQAHQSWWDGKVTVYTQDKDGAYFIYEMACSEEDAAKLVPGTAIRVMGYKSEWSGEIEITDATFEFIDGNYVAEPEDVTALIGSDELVNHQNELVSFKGMTIESVAFKNDQPGDDIYVTASKDGVSVSFCLEYYLNGSDAAFYEKVSNLKAGDVADIEGFLYWYNGANPHMTAVTVTAEAPAASAYNKIGLNLKNKTGIEIAAAYLYVTGAEDKGAPVVTAWPDKDADGDNYEKFVYVVRDPAESYTFYYEFVDGTNDKVETALDGYTKISLRAPGESAKVEALSEAEDGEDIASIQAVVDAGKTADNYYPGYKTVVLEVKNKTEKDVAEFYIMPAGTDRAASKNVVAEYVNEEGNKIDGVWTSGKGGFYIYSFIYVPEDTEALDVILVYADGTEYAAEGLADFFKVNGDGLLPNELSMKSADDSDLWKIEYDDGEELPALFDAALAAGVPMNNVYPVY